VAFVAGSIAIELLKPPFTAVGWCGAILATPVPVPETTVNEDDGLVFGQHDVGSAWQLLPVKTKAKAESMQQRADALLRGRVLAADAAHVPRTARARETVFAATVTHEN